LFNDNDAVQTKSMVYVSSHRRQVHQIGASDRCIR